MPLLFTSLRSANRKGEVTNETEIMRCRKQNSPAEQLRDLADRQSPLIASAFREVIKDLQLRLNEQELAYLIESGEIYKILDQLKQDVIEDAAQVFSAAISTAVLAGAALSAKLQPSVQGPSGSVNFVFNATNPRLSQYATTQTSQRIREVGDDIRSVTAQIIRDGAVRGDNPITTARRVRESIGLTARQEMAVSNYRRFLETGDRASLARALRDRRFDSTIERSLRGEKPLTQQQIDKMVTRYRERFIRYRSEVIARTESIRAVQGSQWELFQSYIDSGKISEAQVRRFWHFTEDDRTRDAHRMVPDMNKHGVGQNEAFNTPDGPLRFPGDPKGLPKAVINCRCSVFARVVSAELL